MRLLLYWVAVMLFMILQYRQLTKATKLTVILCQSNTRADGRSGREEAMIMANADIQLQLFRILLEFIVDG